jgi:hypothetical protein
MSKFHEPCFKFLEAKNTNNNLPEARDILKELIGSDRSGWRDYLDKNFKGKDLQTVETAVGEEHLLPDFDNTRTPVEETQLEPEPEQDQLIRASVRDEGSEYETHKVFLDTVNGQPEPDPKEYTYVYEQEQEQEPRLSKEQFDQLIREYADAKAKLYKCVTEVELRFFLSYAEALPPHYRLLLQHDVPPATLWDLITKLFRAETNDKDTEEKVRQETYVEMLAAAVNKLSLAAK